LLHEAKAEVVRRSLPADMQPSTTALSPRALTRHFGRIEAPLGHEDWSQTV
jgi:hypothetical protein